MTKKKKKTEKSDHSVFVENKVYLNYMYKYMYMCGRKSVILQDYYWYQSHVYMLDNFISKMIQLYALPVEVVIG